MQEPPDGAPPPRIAPPRPDALPAPVLPPGTFRANLYLYLPDGRIEWYALLPGQLGDGRGVFIGRSERCHVRIDDDAVSSRHARILADEGGLRVEDLGSTNGTTLDGEPVDSAPLPDGALLGLGNVDARFIYSFRQPVVRLSLSFVEGPDAGRVETLSGASTTLGRLNCALMLKGPG
ncbi:MAG: FHA domain-containing protein, partial [Myxococcales bacterium]|nr:FHA domain-containing protein [Myxococcales bacterium]